MNWLVSFFAILAGVSNPLQSGSSSELFKSTQPPRTRDTFMAFEIEQPGDSAHSPVVEPTKPRLLGVLGPGLITGASDDDPSGIATYSQAGAQFGYLPPTSALPRKRPV